LFLDEATGNTYFENHSLTFQLEKMGNYDFEDELLLWEWDLTRVLDVPDPKATKLIETLICHKKLKQAYRCDNSQN
jgi:hypothetical protein